MKFEKRFVILTMICSCLLFLCILPLGHDLWYHLYRIGAMAVEMEKNIFEMPIRILSDTYNGYGYGAALYYGDLFLYIPAFLVYLGLDVVVAYKIFMAGIWLGTFGVAYYSFGLVRKDNKSSMLFAFLYTFSSCCALNLCVRSAIGESLAMIFLPMIFAAFYCLIYKEKEEKKYWFLLAAGMSAVAVSHMISLLWCIIILGIWAGIEWKKIFFEKKWISILKAALLMIGVSASFLFPMFEQMLFQKVQTATNSEYQKQAFMDYGIEWIDYFIPYEAKKVFVSLFEFEWNIEFWHPGTIGLFAILLILCGFFFKHKWSGKMKIIYYVSIAALIALGIQPVMNVVKEAFSFMQFSWRILPFITLGLAAAGTWMAVCVKNKKLTAILYLCTLGIFLCAVGPRYLYQLYAQRNDYQAIKEENPDYYHKYLFKYDPNAADALYLPQGVWAGIYLERGEAVEADQQNVEYSWERTQNSIVVDIIDNPYKQVSMEMPLYMYKGYAAETENGEKLGIFKSENGLVCVEAGNYQGTITVWYQGTLCQKLSDLITFLTLISYVLFHQLQKKRGSRKRQ